MNREEILTGMRECIAEALSIEAEAIREEDKLIDDLGADSLDLLDLMFQLQERFQVTISPRDMERRIQGELGDAPYEVDGIYTPAALAELRRSMPEVPLEELPTTVGRYL